MIKFIFGKIYGIKQTTDNNDYPLSNYNHNERSISSSSLTSSSPLKENIIVKLVTLFGKKATNGNPARDHLANERTVLAYIRTSLNMILYGLILLQLGEYIIVKPIDDLKITNAINNEQLVIYNNTLEMLKNVYKFSKSLAAIVFSLSFIVLIFGAIRYCRMFQLLFSDHDVFESGLLFNLVIFFGVIPIIVIAFVYAYKL